MNGSEKNMLLNLIDNSHTAIHGILEGVDLEMLIHKDSNWRIRDILGHIATWDRETTKSLHAFLSGSEYFIAELDEEETDFNEQSVAEQRKLSNQQIVSEWEQSREDLKIVLSNIPEDRFPGDLLFPWGDERGSIAELMEFICEHDEEHRKEIAKAVQVQ